MKRVFRLKQRNMLLMVTNDTITIPSLCNHNSNIVIGSLVTFYKNYMNYNTTNSCTEYYFGQFASLLKSNRNNSNTIRSLNFSLNILLKTLNSSEHTRISNIELNKIENRINSISISDFYHDLENKNRKYKLVENLLKANYNSYLSFISKFCFHLACATFSKDCGYSKYDKNVSSNLYLFLDYYGYNKKTFSNSFVHRNINSYIEYCKSIGFLKKVTKQSRNDIDQTIWLFYK